MKPLKGKLVLFVSHDSSHYWEIDIPGQVKVGSMDTYATKRGAERSARLWAKKLGIELL